MEPGIAADLPRREADGGERAYYFKERSDDDLIVTFSPPGVHPIAARFTPPSTGQLRLQPREESQLGGLYKLDLRDHRQAEHRRRRAPHVGHQGLAAG